MRLIESPNRWSCLPCSFAMALEISLNEMLTRIGHDGSEIIWPQLAEPQRRRTFHIQECFSAAFSLNKTVMEFQFSPTLTPDGEHVLDVPQKVDIYKLMSVSTGVLLGRGRCLGHAVAWNGKSVYDPNGSIYDIENQSIFTPMTYYNIISK